jgi:hypothetical protein
MFFPPLPGHAPFSASLFSPYSSASPFHLSFHSHHPLPPLLLETNTTPSEEDLQENDSDLTFLRLGLKAIEVQCPPNTDIELRQSIDNWKADWARLKQKRARQLGRESAGKDISIFRSPRTPR